MFIRESSCHFWVHIVFNMCCTACDIFDFMNYFLMKYFLKYCSTAHYFEFCIYYAFHRMFFFAISKNITHALNEQKRPCKVGFNVYVRKTSHQSKIPCLWGRDPCSVAYQGVRNVNFSENLACYVFLKHPFWDSPFCLITDE